MTHSDLPRPHSFVPLICQFTPLPTKGSVFEIDGLAIRCQKTCRHYKSIPKWDHWDSACKRIWKSGKWTFKINPPTKECTLCPVKSSTWSDFVRVVNFWQFGETTEQGEGSNVGYVNDYRYYLDTSNKLRFSYVRNSDSVFNIISDYLLSCSVKSQRSIFALRMFRRMLLVGLTTLRS